MTQTSVFEAGKPQNPLYTKLRRKFSYDNRTPAEFMMHQVRMNEASVAGGCPTAEHHILCANNLPRASAPVRKKAKAPRSRAAMFFAVISVILLAGVIFSCYNNYRLNEKYKGLESQLQSSSVPLEDNSSVNDGYNLILPEDSTTQEL